MESGATEVAQINTTSFVRNDYNHGNYSVFCICMDMLKVQCGMQLETTHSPQYTNHWPNIEHWKSSTAGLTISLLALIIIVHK